MDGFLFLYRAEKTLGAGIGTTVVHFHFLQGIPSETKNLELLCFGDAQQDQC